MSLKIVKEVFVALLLIIAIMLGMMLGAAIADLAIDIPTVCFGVSGIFCALFCYGAVIDRVPKDKRDKIAIYVALTIIAMCALLFFAAYPLGGNEYSWAFKSFAITQSLATLLLWRGKFHNE